MAPTLWCNTRQSFALCAALLLVSACAAGDKDGAGDDTATLAGGSSTSTASSSGPEVTATATTLATQVAATHGPATGAPSSAGTASAGPGASEQGTASANSDAEGAGGAGGSGSSAVASGPLNSGTSAQGTGGESGAGTATGGLPNIGGATGVGGADNASGGTAEGAAGADTEGEGGGPGVSGEGCTRELLTSTLEDYFTALEAHDPSTLALADGVKFTENGEVVTLGEAGLWLTAGALKYQHSALDTETCNAVSQAVVPDGSDDIPFGLRIKLVDQQITEIETIAVRDGDYKVSGQPFASNTDAMIASEDVVKWAESVPEDQQNTRDELIAWMNKYYRLFPRGVCNVVSDCTRLENGGGSFSCGAGAGCDSGELPDPGNLTPRLIVADVERGIGVGFTMFQDNTDMHMFKMYGSDVYAVHAILGGAESSGWD